MHVRYPSENLKLFLQVKTTCFAVTVWFIPGNGMYTIYNQTRPDYGIPKDHWFTPGDAHVGEVPRATRAGPGVLAEGQFDDAD